MIAVGSREGHLPAAAEQRMTEFTDLVATAVANAQNRAALEASRDELARLLTEQAALRRVATLVARGVDPAEVFSAVAEEVRRLLDADRAGIARFEHDGKSVVVLGGSGKDEDVVQWPAGTRVAIPGYAALGMVWRTGRPAQANEDTWSGVSDAGADALRELGIRSTVASPIIVEGRLWGAANAWTRREAFPSDTADRMADFTELVATAVGNAESRAELAASRARIVAAADQTGGGSSGTCTTAPSSGWSRSASSSAWRRASCRPSWVSSRRRSAGSRTSSAGWWRICARSPAASTR